MSWKKIIIMLLLLAAALGIPYHLYIDGQIDTWQQQFIDELEQNLGVEVEYEQLSLLPLNRISIGDLYVSGEDFSLEISRLNLYYDLNRFLANLYRERLEIELLPAVMDSLEVVELEELAAEVNRSEAEHLQLSELEELGQFEEEVEIHPSILWDYLPALPRNAQIVIEDGGVSYSESRGGVEVSDLRVEAASPERDRLDLAASGNVEITGLTVQNYELSPLSFEDILVDSRLQQEDWSLDAQLRLESPETALNSVLEQLEPEVGSVALSGLSSQPISASLTGSGSELQQLQVDSGGSLSGLSFQADEFSPDELWPEAADELQQDEVEITDINWELSYDFSSAKIYLPELTFSLFQGNFSGSGYISPTDPLADFLLDLTGENIELEEIFTAAGGDLLLQEREEISYQPGTGSLDFQAVGSEEGPRANLQASVDDSALNGLDFSTELLASWQGDIIKLEQAEFDFGPLPSAYQESSPETEAAAENERQKLNLTGTLTPDTLAYDFNLQVQNLSADMFSDRLMTEELLASLGFAAGQEYWPRAGIFNSTLEGTGQGADLAEVQAWGDITVEQVQVKDFPRLSLQTDFWLSDGKLDINLLHLQTPPGSLELTGSIDILREDLDLWLETDEIDLQEAVQLVPEEALEEDLAGEIRGETSLSGRISGSFAAPDLSTVIHLPRAEIFGVEVEEGRGELSYNPAREKFVLEDLDFMSRQARVISQGSLDIASELPSPELEFTLDIDNLSYEYINDIFDLALPLTGDVGGTVDIFGPVDDIRVESRAQSHSTVFAPEFMPEYELEFQNSRASFFWQEGEPFQVRELYMEREQAAFSLDADFGPEQFWADYNLQNYQLVHAASEFPGLDYDIAGSAAVIGEASGSYENPSARAELMVDDIVYQQQRLGQLQGEIELDQGELIIPAARWLPGSGQLQVQGRVGELMSEQEPELDLSLQAENMELEYYLQELGYELDFPTPYIFTGNIAVTGTPADPAAEIDARLVGEEFGWGEVRLAGEISDHYNLSLFGSGIQLSYMAAQFPLDYADLRGGIQLEGELSGPLAAPRAEMSTRIIDISINGYNLREVTGRAVLDEDLNLHLEQELLAAPAGRLGLEADFSLQEEIEEGSFVLRAEDFPLGLADNFMPAGMSLAGELNGEVEGRGSLTDPRLTGRLDFDLEELDIDQPDKIRGETGLVFEDDKIELADADFQLGAGELTAGGYFDLTNLEEFWNLELSGEQLPLEYMGSTVDISGDLQITGAPTSPVIAGDSRFDNLTAVLPEGETEVPEQVAGQEGNFTPQLDINIRAGSNNMVQHENAEIIIEAGNLRLLYRDRLTLDGRLTSRQGWAFFYNNQFRLESARVEFAASRGVIPRVSVRAATRAGGADITVNIDGTPDNITTEFTSRPEMSEQEILALLTRRGGVSGFITGEDRSIPGLIFQETRRFLSDTLQLQILGWQRTLREQLELDRLEIITHDLGWEQEVSLYMGRDLTDRLYLETQSDFGPDNHRTDIIFNYALTEYTSLGGNLLDVSTDGWEDFSITIETGIEF